MKTSTLVLFGAGALLLMAGGSVSLGGNLSAAQIGNYAQAAGFSGTDLINAVSVALAESYPSGNPRSYGDVDIPVAGAASYGLWQINSYYHPEYGPDFTVLYDPQTNANAAYKIYRAAGYSFSPWSTYTHGQYTQYVSGVMQALNA